MCSFKKSYVAVNIQVIRMASGCRSLLMSLSPLLLLPCFVFGDMHELLVLLACRAYTAILLWWNHADCEVRETGFSEIEIDFSVSGTGRMGPLQKLVLDATKIGIFCLCLLPFYSVLTVSLPNKLLLSNQTFNFP